MKYSRLIFTVTGILVLAADNAAAERVFEVHKEFSGSSAPIAMDLNNDGFPAIRALGGGGAPVGSVPIPARARFRYKRNPSEGEFTADNVSEGVLVLAPTGKCAAGEFEFETIHYSSVHRYSNGDLLFAGGLQDGFTCFNLLTGRGYGIVRLNYVGGTGRFEGAQGEIVREFQGVALDPTGLRSAFTGRTTGTLILPD